MTPDLRIHCFQDVPFEGLGSIEPWAQAHRHALTTTRFYRGDPLPTIEDCDWLIVMGGPMGVHDEDRYPWLRDEKRLIEQAIKAERVVIGICLGAQLIAAVLGARVYPHRFKEIGWFPIELTEAGQRSPLFGFLPRKLDVFHWHGDTFDLPPGAVHIAQSEGCRHQAFVYRERVVGLQFHLESTPAGVEDLLRNCAGDLGPGRYIQDPQQMLKPKENFARINEAMGQLLARLPTLEDLQ